MSKDYISTSPAFLPFGGTTPTLLEPFLSGHSSAFIRGDLYTPTTDNLSYLNDKLLVLKPFRIVLLTNRAIDSLWTSWADHWLHNGQGKPLGGINCMDFKSYTPQGTTWASCPGCWELILIEGTCIQEVGQGLDHKAFLSAIRNLIGRKAGKFKPFYHPLSSSPAPRPPKGGKYPW